MQFALYSRRALLQAASNCISQLAALSVHRFGEAGVLAVQALLELERTFQRELNGDAAASSSQGDTSLSAGATATSLATALLQGFDLLRSVYLSAVKDVEQLVRQACPNLDNSSSLLVELDSLAGQLQTVSAGLGVDGDEVRASIVEATQFLLPSATLFAPSLRQLVSVHSN